MDVGRGIVRRQADEVAQVVAIHGEDQVEAVEVFDNQLARPLACYVDAIGSPDGDRAMIRGIAVMPTAGARRRGFDQVRQATLLRTTAQDGFTQRRAADIAETNEKNSPFFHAMFLPDRESEDRMAREKLPTTEIAKRLQAMDGWVLANDAMSISKTFKFGNFVEAFGFMTECAIHAEKLNHHPEWSNVYKTR